MSELLIDQDVLQSTLERALREGGDFAEVFVEDRRSSSARFDDGRVEELVSGRDRGAGLRVVRGDTTGFAHTADLSPAGLLAASDAAAAAARGGGGGTRVVALSRRETPARTGDDVIAPETVEKARKVELLRTADAAAREQGGAITSVTASYSDAHRRIVVANSDGLLADDDQVRTRVMVQCVATGDTGMQTGYEAPGRTMGFELFDTVRPAEVGRTAATRALSLLDAVPAPTGRIPVVLRRGAGGVLFHEACGHGLEADHIYKDASVFSGNMGELVASPLVTLVDDGTYGREWGTLSIDDEGHPAQRNVLIENGVLTEFMWDLLRARKEGHASSGNGRRETYKHLPMPRMTNTFVLEGDTEPDDIVQSVEYGLYCVQLGGGQVNPATGDFVFGVTEAYLIEHGEITRPVRAAQLIGNGPDVLRGIDAVGNDFDTWTGMCGKNGQSVPVSSGQPTVLVREITVGGTARVSDLLDIARGVAATARSGEQVEAYVVRSRDTDVEVFGGEVESLTTAVVEGIGVRVIADHRQGYAWAGSLDESVVAETLRDARDNAKFGEPDEWYALAGPADLDGVTAPVLDLWRDELLTVATEEKVRIALDLDRATKAADPRIRNVESSSYGDSLSEGALANSLGVVAEQRRTTCGASSAAIADDGTGAQTGYGYVAGRTLADLDLESVPRDAATRACRLLGARPIPGRRIPVILDPLVTRSVLGVLSSAFNGESVLKGRSLFAGREGEQIGATRVTVLDDPTDPRALGAAGYDGEGVPTRPIALIDRGVLRGFLQNIYTGRRSGAGTTGSAVRGYTSTPGVGVRALRLEPGEHSPEEIMASVPEALYVQSVSGLHSGTNPISGDFSVGAEGLMVRGGDFAEPVREVTIASTLQRMLLDIADVGADLTFLPGSVAGMTVLVSEMTLSGQ